MMRLGLTLGKYAPLHKGHLYVIKEALKKMDKLYVLVYDSPSTTDIPLSVRADWVLKETGYPSRMLEVIKGFGSPEECGMTPEIQKLQEDYIKSMLGNLKIDTFYSSESYGDHVSKALGCNNVVVDLARVKVPISATKIRENPYLHRKFIPNQVYQSLVKKVLFLGGPSTGKSTIARRMSEDLGGVYMPEYGREYWEEHQENKRLTLEDLTRIAQGHIQRENEKVLQADKYLFVDTSALTTQLFSEYYHEGVSQLLLRRYADDGPDRYDVVFLCDENIPYEDTWDRSGPGNRHWFQRRYIDELAMRRIPYTLLTGTVDDRVKKVKEVLGEI